MLNKKELMVIEVRDEIPDTKTIVLAIGGIAFDYQAGQYVSIFLNIENCDDEGDVRVFSLASSPTDKGKLIVTTRVSKSSFKMKFAELCVGDKVKVSGPFGRFTLHEDYTKPAIMLSGGIGITPLRGMIKYATDNKISMKIVLLYSSKTPESILYKSELDDLLRENKNLKIVHTITNSGDSELGTLWTGRIGFIDGELITSSIPDGTDPYFYICGPPSMVSSMLQALKGLHVPAERIKIENFTGYE